MQSTFDIRQFDDGYLVSRSSIGAASFFTPGELVAFQTFLTSGGDKKSVVTYLNQCQPKCTENESIAQSFVVRLSREGWTRTDLRPAPRRPLMSVYFTLTRACNFSCPYCYQGLEDREKTSMSYDDAVSYLDMIHKINSDCSITVTGGEPFLNKDVFRILDAIKERDFRFSLLTNGSALTQKTTDRLANYQGLTKIQISLDGMTKEVHSLTRGDTFDSVMKGIHNVINRKLPFSLAPTAHEGNLHQLNAIASFALKNDGDFSPNNLRATAHTGSDDLASEGLSLTDEDLLNSAESVAWNLVDEFGIDQILEKRKKRTSAELITPAPPAEQKDCNNAHLNCGLGYSLIDINWNGDVYPCHLLKEKRFILGNLKRNSFEEIVSRGEKLGTRTKSSEVPKCKKCSFVGICGSGCKASAYFAFGTFMREDPSCEALYKSSLNNLKTFATSNNFKAKTRGATE